MRPCTRSKTVPTAQTAYTSTEQALRSRLTATNPATIGSMSCLARNNAQFLMGILSTRHHFEIRIPVQASTRSSHGAPSPEECGTACGRINVALLYVAAATPTMCTVPVQGRAASFNVSWDFPASGAARLRTVLRHKQSGQVPPHGFNQDA